MGGGKSKAKGKIKILKKQMVYVLTLTHPSHLSKLKNELKAGSLLRGCLSECFSREFRSSPVFRE